MPRFLVALSLILTFESRASAQISKSDMLSRIDKERVTFQRAPLFMVPDEVTKKLLERTKARYPQFKESMWFYNYVIDKGYYNIVFYDWTGDECQYFTFNQEALNQKNKDVVAFVNNPAKGNSSAKKEVIPVKYCEKLYNFYSKK